MKENNFKYYYDENIKINKKKYPVDLLEVYEIMDNAYKNNDPDKFIAYRDAVEEGVKAYCGCGVLSESDLNDIRCKLGYFF